MPSVHDQPGRRLPPPARADRDGRDRGRRRTPPSAWPRSRAARRRAPSAAARRVSRGAAARAAVEHPPRACAGAAGRARGGRTLCQSPTAFRPQAPGCSTSTKYRAGAAVPCSSSPRSFGCRRATLLRAHPRGRGVMLSRRPVRRRSRGAACERVSTWPGSPGSVPTVCTSPSRSVSIAAVTEPSRASVPVRCSRRATPSHASSRAASPSRSLTLIAASTERAAAACASGAIGAGRAVDARLSRRCSTTGSGSVSSTYATNAATVARSSSANVARSSRVDAEGQRPAQPRRRRPRAWRAPRPTRAG